MKQVSLPSLAVICVAFTCLIFSLSGCHTIRPSGQASSTYLEQIPRYPVAVGLVMDDHYRNYVSKDRGSAIADPQKYMVGNALNPLTVSYFNKAFSSVHVYDQLPDRTGVADENYLVRVRVLKFDNEYLLTEQEIIFSLEGEVYGRDLKLLGTVKGEGYEEGRLGAFSATSDSAVIVNKALEEGLLDLLKALDPLLNTRQS